MNDNAKQTDGAFKEGESAAAAGEPTSNNPFPQDDPAHEGWLKGWRHAMAANGNIAPDDV